MNMKCEKCGRFAPLDTFRTVPGTNEFVCGNCFDVLSVPAMACDSDAGADLGDAPGDEVDDDLDDVLDDELEDTPEETISQRANRIWRQRQIDKLEKEYEVLDAELDSLRDDIGYDRITMDEEDCLVGETIYGLQIQDRLEEIENELELLRSKQ